MTPTAKPTTNPASNRAALSGISAPLLGVAPFALRSTALPLTAQRRRPAAPRAPWLRNFALGYWCFCLSIAITTLLASSVALAAASSCDALSGAQKKLATEILQSQHAYDCCDKSLAECLKQKPVCRLVKRLSEDVCRRVAAGQAKADIERALARRATSMTATGNTYRIELNDSVALGKPEAKVSVVAYVCPRCPYCAKLMRELEKSVADGKLAGKVKLYAKLFPVRGHVGSTEASIALVAAQQFGKFWDYLLQLYRDFDHFDVNKLGDVAAGLGIDRQKFDAAVKDEKTRNRVVESKKEGVRNAVESTPTLFINGRKYVGELSLQAVEDVLEEEHDRLTGKQHD
jgi:protein-disulfide isomerase